MNNNFKNFIIVTLGLWDQLCSDDKKNPTFILHLIVEGNVVVYMVVAFDYEHGFCTDDSKLRTLVSLVCR